MTESDSQYNDELSDDSKKCEPPCSFLHCKNIGKIKLTIIFTHRFGFFCSKCFEYLQDNDLIDSFIKSREKQSKIGGKLAP